MPLEIPTEQQMTITNIWITARNGDSEGFKKEIESLSKSRYLDGYADGWDSETPEYSHTF